MARKQQKQDDEDTTNTQVRYFVVDLGFEAGEEFCKNLLSAGDFSTVLLRSFAAHGSKSLKKDKLAAHVAERIQSGDVDADKFVLAYCRQPRQWLCVRFGSKGSSWPKKQSATELLTKNSKTNAFTWYGPFGTEDERWYVATKQVQHFIEVGDGEYKAVPMRWQVAAQINPRYAALHWYNASTRDRESVQNPVQFPYWHHIDDIFGDLRTMLHGEWDREEPNLAEIVLHSAFDRYVESKNHRWVHKAVRSNYESVALNASGSTGGGTKEERAASGLQVLTQELALTAAKAVGIGKDAVAVAKMEHAILRQILREWGTKSYEFILDDEAANKALARMRIYFGSDNSKDSKQTQDTVQHVHCFTKYGGSTGALNFIMEEWEVDNVDDQDPLCDE